ncbi:translation initiation factor IF-2-like [Myotis myotis]|uniref:translation initiation factor IF-2-like n=1 Tax=Myotis myotis TaxID=51298 RepID=UPI00174EC2EF|nr:translation initiation factor IF-2-like [Myotis myotis]
MARPQDEGEGTCDGAAHGRDASRAPVEVGPARTQSLADRPAQQSGAARPDFPAADSGPRRDQEHDDAAAVPGGAPAKNFPAPLARLTSAPSTAAGAPSSAAPGPRAPSDRAPVAAAAGSPAETGAAAQTAAAPSSRVLVAPLRRADPSGTFATLLAFHGRHVTARHARSAPPALPGPAATCGPALSPPARRAVRVGRCP